MLPLEHSAILWTFIKLPFVIKIFVLSIFEWLLKTGFIVIENKGLWLENVTITGNKPTNGTTNQEREHNDRHKEKNNKKKTIKGKQPTLFLYFLSEVIIKGMSMTRNSYNDRPKYGTMCNRHQNTKIHTIGKNAI